mgnify:CR=1 FL=1|jgi:hypothetical protein|tara:strand:- start:940 stop:1200 length:261 start_codon:yes stop_codon:yes gene_type:complete
MGPHTPHRQMKKLEEVAEEVLSEIPMFTPKSDKLVPFINKAIDKVDDSLSITDFALAVTKIVEQEYGSHLYADFFKIVKVKMQKAT